MEKINLEIIVKKAFGNLYRSKCVLIAVGTSEDKILLGAKPSFFPPTITRLLGGGVDEGEDIATAAVRELEEELGVSLDVSDLTPLFDLETRATDETGKVFNNNTYVYYVNIGNQSYKAGDDVTSIDALSVDELYDLGVRYEQLPESLFYIGREGEFSWQDYGKMYGPIHKIAADKLRIH
jgi:8-oxo-dGTP pyrophosphatase MutT (NUDIX family)